MKLTRNPDTADIEMINGMLLECSKDGKYYLMTEESGSILLAPKEFVEKYRQKSNPENMDNTQKSEENNTKRMKEKPVSQSTAQAQKKSKQQEHSEKSPDRDVPQEKQVSKKKGNSNLTNKASSINKASSTY